MHEFLDTYVFVLLNNSIESIMLNKGGTVFHYYQYLYRQHSPHVVTSCKYTVSILSLYQYPPDTSQSIHSSDQHPPLPPYHSESSLKLVMIEDHLDGYALSLREIFVWPSPL